MSSCDPALLHKRNHSPFKLYPYFKGECSLEDAVERLKMQTRRYAKRQLTWFRRIDSVNWFYPDVSFDLDDIFNLTEKFLKEE